MDNEEIISTTEKANAILQDLKSKGCNFYFVSSELKEVSENYSTSVFEFLYKNKNENEKIFKIPVIFDNRDYSRNFIKVIEELKIFLLFNINGVIPDNEQTKTVHYDNKSTITQNQKRLLYDKLKKPNLKFIIEERIKSLGLRSIEDLSKEDASAVIDVFQKR